MQPCVNVKVIVSNDDDDDDDADDVCGHRLVDHVPGPTSGHVASASRPVVVPAGEVE